MSGAVLAVASMGAAAIGMCDVWLVSGLRRRGRADFLEGPCGKIIVVLSLAGGIIDMASSRFSLGQVAIPVAVGIGIPHLLFLGRRGHSPRSTPMRRDRG